MKVRREFAFLGLGLLFVFGGIGGCAKSNCTRIGSASAKECAKQNGECNPAPGLDAVFWHQKSEEYRGATRNLFSHAAIRLSQALGDSTWTASVEQMERGKPYPEQTAVILDIDETVLNNSPLYARQVQDPDYDIGAGWASWTNEAKAEALAGAVELIKDAVAQNVTVFFVSNRSCTQDDATRQNMKDAGFPVDSPNVIFISRNTDYTDPTKPADSCPKMEAQVREMFGVTNPKFYSYKGTRRAMIATKYRILLLFGDSQGDFYSLEPEPDMSELEKVRLWKAHLTPAEREEIDASRANLYTDRWMQLPNSMYGNWQSSWLGYQSLTIQETTEECMPMLDTD